MEVYKAMTLPSTKLLLAGMSAVALGAAALTIAPVYHNFGKVVVMSFKEQTFTTTLPPGVTHGTLTYSVTGPDAVDFLGSGTFSFSANNPSSGCQSGPQGVVCEWSVEFRPRSIGPKRATLGVSDRPGSWTSAALEGEAVAALCTNRVVFCNYAHHYSGVFSWQGGGEQVTVDVLMGVASCNGTAPGGGRIQGQGLIGVEFGPVSSIRTPASFYRITVACPSPAFPARDGYPATPSEPAELGHGEQSSDKQPLAMTQRQIQEGLPSLKRSITYPAQDAESGVFTVSWDLCPNGRTIPSVGGQARCSP